MHVLIYKIRLFNEKVCTVSHLTVYLISCFQSLLPWLIITYYIALIEKHVMLIKFLIS